MAWNMLVIGGTGMLGEPVARRLASGGYRVRVLSRNPDRVAARFAGVCDIVRGDVDDQGSLAQAMSGCVGVHLSLDGAGDWDLERRGAAAVAALAPKASVQRITMISGASVCPENAWFPMTRAKLAAEDALRASGVPFSVFRCSMFMEMLIRFVRSDKALIMGRQPRPWRWIAAEDYAAMVARAYELPEAAGKTFHIRGPQALTVEQALRVYQKLCAPRAKLTHVPFWVLQIMALAPGRRELRRVGLPIMRYFSKVQEVGDPTEAEAMLGAPETTLEAWCRKSVP